MSFTAHIIEPGVSLPLFWVLCVLGVLCQAISKSGFAGGLGILSVPMMALVMPVDRVAGVLLPILVLCDINAVYYHRRSVVWLHVRRIFLPALPGILLGGAVWWYMGSTGMDVWGPLLKRVVGVVAIAFAAYIFVRDVFQQWAARHRMGLGWALGLGFATGFTSTLVHAAGPIANLYIFSQGLGKTVFVGTVAWTFLFINVAKLPVYVTAGLFDPDVLWLDLCLVPLIPVGSWLGHWMHHRVPERPFNWVVLVLSLLAGVQLMG